VGGEFNCKELNRFAKIHMSLQPIICECASFRVATTTIRLGGMMLGGSPMRYYY